MVPTKQKESNRSRKPTLEYYKMVEKKYIEQIAETFAGDYELYGYNPNRLL
jgi:hypothetical protein